MSKVTAAQPNIGGALCGSSVIPFLVPRHKVWLMPLLDCRAVTLPILEKARRGHKVNFAPGKFRHRVIASESVYTPCLKKRPPFDLL